MSEAVEDTMEVDEDMRMDEDPTGTPMSTDDDSAQGVGSGLKDDTMASPANEVPSDMDADTIASPPPPETGGGSKPPVSGAASKPPDSAGEDESGVPDGSSDNPARLDRSGSSDLPDQTSDKDVSENNQNTSREEEDETGEGHGRTDRERDPLLEGNSNSKTDLDQKETSNASRGSAADDSDGSESENENSNLATPRSPEKSDTGKSLADELAEAKGADSKEGKSPSDAETQKKSSGDEQDANDDHISLSGSSAGDDDDHVSIAGSSDVDEGPVDHVSVDSDSETDGDQSKNDKDAASSSHTEPIDDNVGASAEDEQSAADESGKQQTPQLQLKQITSLQSPSHVNATPKDNSKVVVSDDGAGGSALASGSAPSSSEKFRGSITLLGKQAESEMIISDGPPIITTNMPGGGAPPSLPFSSKLPAAAAGSESRVGASIKAHYSVKKINNLIYNKCLHCASDQRCPWKVTIGAKDHYICSDKCMEEHRVQRRQILESGAPPVSTIIQIADLSSLEKKCASCQKVIPKWRLGSLSWEVMEFCDEECLTSYQITNTSKCCNCKTGVNTSSMGKYCVRFGHEVKQFCSPACLDTYKKAIKTCSYCQKNLQDSGEGFLAAVGGKDQFRDFCSQDCLEKYDCICNNSCASFSVENCVVCDNTKVTFYELLTGDKVAALCSDVCLAAYKFVNNIEVGVCGMCNKYYDKHSVDESITFNNETPSSFCSKHCMNISVISKRKIVPCAWCKAKKYNFDMILRRGSNQDDGMFVCSVNCLALHNVSSKAIPSAKITCSYCKKFEVSTYHLTMSDATVRHFCSYDCVLTFQAPFNTTVVNTNQPVPTGVPKKVTVTVSSAAASPPNNSVPTIQAVGSLKAIEPPPLIGSSATKTTAAAGSKVKTTTLKIPSSFCLKPPDMKNKWTQITVCSLSKCVSCRPKKEDRDSQCSLSDESPTDNTTTSALVNKTAENSEKSSDASNKIFVPVPVPIYVPYPVAMYTLPSPVPLAVPVPFVVPIIVPTAMDNMDQVIATMKEILEKAGKNESFAKPTEGSKDDSTAGGKNNGRKREFPGSDEKDDEKSAKRSRLTEEAEDDKETEKMKLKFKLGVSAWKHFVKRWNESVDQDDQDCPRLKADLLAMRPPELNSALALFIREAKKDNGSPYRPDLKFYLSLGIQYYLSRNKRPDDIFGDALYEEFTDVLDEEARKFHSGDTSVSRVEEEHLWESMQLGAKSPQALLTTLVYFITLHFNLWTIEEHMQLSFSSFVQTHKTSSSSAKPSDAKVIRLSLNDSSGKKQEVLELVENKQDPLRCPVRLYEFYLTKCPGNVTSHDDRFYLMPETSCVPESPVWYRSLALPPQSVEKMLNRVKLIKEICEAKREQFGDSAEMTTPSA